MIDRDGSDAHREDDDRTIREIVDEAFTKWEALTGVGRDRTSFTLGTLGISSMNDMLTEMLEADPEGTTSYLLLECFLRFYLEDKTFTAASIMRDYEATTAFLRDAEALFSIVQSDRAVEIASEFRSRVRAGLARYGADGPEIEEFLEDQNVLAFLRRDALRSLENLTPYQFLSGADDAAHPQVVEHVYIAWSVNDLLAAVRDMKVSGIAVVLMRDAGHPERSYFTFAMRNGDNVILFTDKRKPAYPGQADRLSARGGPGQAREYAARTESNHFPYQIIPTSLDHRGDVVFDRETAPVAAGPKLAPLMRISDLPPEQAIWITMMLSLIADRFWTKAWRAPELSYTGAMIRDRGALVTDDSGAALPVAAGYREITLDPVTLDDVTAEAMAEQCNYAPEGLNAWLEARYRDRVDAALLNIWTPGPRDKLFLPKAGADYEHNAWNRQEVTEAMPGVLSVVQDGRTPRHWMPAGYDLETFSESEFGTEEELRQDRLFIARKNMAAMVRKCAEEEYAARKDGVAAWYREAVGANLPALCDIIADGEEAWMQSDGKWRVPFLILASLDSDRFHSFYAIHNVFGDYVGGRKKYECVLTGAAASWRAHFRPTRVEDLEVLTGLDRAKFPDVLQHWGRDKRHKGNHLLNRIDPMDSDVQDPWMKLPLDVNVFLSKRGLVQVQARKGSGQAGAGGA